MTKNTAKQKAKQTEDSYNDLAIFDPKADSPLSDKELRSRQNRYKDFNAEIEIPRISKYLFQSVPKKFDILGNTANAFEHLVYDVSISLAKNEPARNLVYRVTTGSVTENHLVVEELLYDLWRKQSSSIPKIFSTFLRTSKFPFDLVVMEKVGTESIESYIKKHPDSKENIFFAKLAGKYLANLHSHKASLSGFGNFSYLAAAQKQQLQGVLSSWREVIHINLQENIQYLLAQKIISKKTATEVQNVLKKNDALLNLKQGVALHGDYHNANILIDAQKKKVVAAIDLSQAKVGDPLFDIAFYSTYVSDNILKAFLQGYASVSKLDRAHKKKIALYRLRISISKAKLRKRFGYNERIPQAIEVMKQAIRDLK